MLHTRTGQLRPLFQHAAALNRARVFFRQLNQSCSWAPAVWLDAMLELWAEAFGGEAGSSPFNLSLLLWELATCFQSLYGTLWERILNTNSGFLPCNSMEQHNTTLTTAHIQTAYYYRGDTNRPLSAHVAMTVLRSSPHTKNGVSSAKCKKKTIKFQVNTELISLCSNVWSQVSGW